MKNSIVTDLAAILWNGSSEPLRGDTLTESWMDNDIVTTIEIPLRVVLFNDNFHTFDEVISQICKATGTSKDRAEANAWEVHTKGKSVVYDGDMGECLRVSSVLEEIALHTQILS
ncbi:MAG TPA: ATP-dependent Clp protease adaptor ClpS [Candidatus Kapabacteria bacterium]|nr:ATP-dependent Clp protease adaptor ClpS [Candidatus Kapabacteria bacterium]